MSIKVSYRKGQKITLDKQNKVGIVVYEDKKYSPLLTTFELQVFSPYGMIGEVRKIKFWFTKSDSSNSKYLIRKMDRVIDEMKDDLIKAGCRSEYAKWDWK